MGSIKIMLMIMKHKSSYCVVFISVLRFNQLRATLAAAMETEDKQELSRAIDELRSAEVPDSQELIDAAEKRLVALDVLFLESKKGRSIGINSIALT